VQAGIQKKLQGKPVQTTDGDIAVTGRLGPRYEGTCETVRKHEAESTGPDGTSELSTDTRVHSTIAIVIGS
jgi:hypothetical protein